MANRFVPEEKAEAATEDLVETSAEHDSETVRELTAAASSLEWTPSVLG